MPDAEPVSPEKAVEIITGKFYEVLAENRKLSRDLENIQDGGMLEESAVDCNWVSRYRRDKQWLLLSGYQQHRIIQKMDVDLYHDLLNYAYQFSPLIRGAIDLKTRYTFGLSFSIQSENNQNKTIIQAIQDDPRNRLAVFSSQAIVEADHELQKGGNLYIAIWHKLKPIQIRTWSSYEITDIITDPEDADMPLFYVRSFGDGKTKKYPSLFNEIYSESSAPGEVRIDPDADVDPDILVYHVYEGKGQKQKWALSPYTAALPWNRAYEGFLLDFAAIVQMIRKYTTMFTSKGGDATINALGAQFASDQHRGSPLNSQVGEGLVVSEGNDYKVVDAGSSKIVGLDDSVYYLSQFCTAVGIPENMLTGNPKTGNRASAAELTANFLPLIEERQTRWSDTFRAIFSRILGNQEFNVSFPPLRSQDALTYLDSLVKTATLGSSTGTLAGVIRPIDFIKAVYESLDLKIPDDTTIDEMVTAIQDKINQNPAMATAVNNLAAAATRMNEVLREEEGNWITTDDGNHLFITRVEK